MTNTRKNILIIGYGEMGHAMEYLLHESHDLFIFEPRPAKNSSPFDLEKAAENSDFVLFCVPAIPIAALAEQILPSLKSDCLLLSIAKGLDDQGDPAASILSNIFGSNFDYGVIYGPMISEEIRANRPAFAQVGLRQAKLFGQVRQLFSGTSLHLNPTEDLCGISWSAILKNVYAILFGIADELDYGDNMRGYLAVEAIRELEEIVISFGGLSASCYNLSGLGDLITTATSAGSHHHELGRMLARGELDAIEGEGIHTLSMVKKYALFDTSRYPLFDLINNILTHPVDIKAKVDSLFTVID